MYEELADHTVPEHQLRAMERCDDRFLQQLAEQIAEGAAIDRVRAEMAADPANRWDQTRHGFRCTNFTKGEKHEARNWTNYHER